MSQDKGVLKKQGLVQDVFGDITACKFAVTRRQTNEDTVLTQIFTVRSYLGIYNSQTYANTGAYFPVLVEQQLE
jgi:hypothetical protein